MRFRHPSPKRLQAWLDGGERELDDHLATCARCADRLEDMAADEPVLRSTLIELLRPPDELDTRLRGGIDERLRAREDLALVSELFAVPLQTVRIMSNTNQGDA